MEMRLGSLRQMLGCGVTAQVAVLVAMVLWATAAGTEGKIIRRIDTHSHFVPKFYWDLLDKRGLNSGGKPNPRWNVSEHLAIMNHLKIDTSILSISAPGARLTLDDVQEGRDLARQLNEYAHMLVVSHPGRFQFYATLCLPDVEGSITEAIYSLDTLKAAGVILFGNSHGEYLGNKKLDPLMEVLNARNATVFVHPNRFDVAPVSRDEEEVDLPSFVIDFLLDTTRAATNLVLKNVTGRNPNIKFILAHSGGFTPFAAYRMAGGVTYFTNEGVLDVLRVFKRFYGDTALSSSPSALPSTLSFFPPDHITFGSDYPYAPNFGIIATTNSLDEFELEDQLRHKINFANADKIFERPLTHWRNLWSQDAARRLGQQDSPSSFKAL